MFMFKCIILLVVGEDVKEVNKDLLAPFSFNHEYIHTVFLSSWGCGWVGGSGAETLGGGPFEQS